MGLVADRASKVNPELDECVRCSGWNALAAELAGKVIRIARDACSMHGKFNSRFARTAVPIPLI